MADRISHRVRYLTALAIVCAVAVVVAIAQRAELESTGSRLPPPVDSLRITPQSDRTHDTSYKMTAQPCIRIDWTPLTDQVGRVSGQVDGSVSSAGSTTTARCSYLLGRGDCLGVARVTITILAEAAAENMYLGLIESSDIGPLMPVQNLGSDAHLYIDGDRGPTVVTHHKNLYLRIMWVPLERQTVPIYNPIVDGLVEIARATMTQLRT